MNVQSQIRADSCKGPATTEHFDVADRGRRHFRRRCGLSSDPAMPGNELCRARGAKDVRRHLEHASLSRHPLRQRPAHLRLSLQAVDQRADRDRRRDPEIHGRGDRGKRSLPPHPLPAHHHLGQMVERRTISGPSTPSGPTPAKQLRFTANFFWMCQGYYRHTEGYTPEWKDMAQIQGPDRASAEMA